MRGPAVLASAVLLGLTTLFFGRVDARHAQGYPAASDTLAARQAERFALASDALAARRSGRFAAAAASGASPMRRAVAANAGHVQQQTRTAVPRSTSEQAAGAYRLSADDDAFLEDLERRAFLFFWEQTDPNVGIIRDRARTDGSPADARHQDIGSIASTGFGLTGLCIAAERQWQPRTALVARARTTLKTFAEDLEPVHGWFYHWLNIHTRAREWKSEVSSIDTALLLGGVLTVRQCFKEDPAIVKLADRIYERVDFKWMLDGDPALLSHGWRPETGFITHRWAKFSEAMILYILGLGSPAAPLPPESWRAWERPQFTYDGYTYVHSASPLFLHQYSHAWIDFRRWRDPVPPQPDWFANSVAATRAQKQFLLSLSNEFPGYSENVWGLTASDSGHGYVAWGGPPRHPRTDGTVVPCAPAGSLMFTPDITVPALREMHRRFGDRIYGRYGFADAFHPTSGWVNPDVIGIDVGITLLSAENLRTGKVWQWFMANDPIIRGLKRGGMTPVS